MTPQLPSNRSFGWTFTGFFLLVGIFGIWRSSPTLSWLFALAGLFAVITLTRAQWLEPLNRAWMKFGALMNAVVSPVILGVIFFGVFTPTGMVMRLIGRDAMARKFDPAARSYWVKRDPAGPADDSFGNMY
jgi:Saxitoxin biosynthesis operon protein SxtJ